MELFSDSQFQSQKLLFVGMILLFYRVHNPACIGDWVIPPISLFLR